MVVVSTAPSVRVTVPEALGLPRDHPQQNWEAELYTALRMLGFPIVFDTNFAADLTIVEEGTELLHRYAPLALALPSGCRLGAVVAVPPQVPHRQAHPDLR